MCFDFSSLSFCLLTVKCADSKAEYFAQRLHQALSGAGTKDRTLIRIVVTRSDVDLGNIKKEYERLYESSLINDVTVISIHLPCVPNLKLISLFHCRVTHHLTIRMRCWPCLVKEDLIMHCSIPAIRWEIGDFSELSASAFV